MILALVGSILCIRFTNTYLLSVSYLAGSRATNQSVLFRVVTTIYMYGCYTLIMTDIPALSDYVLQNSSSTTRANDTNSTNCVTRHQLNL